MAQKLTVQKVCGVIRQAKLIFASEGKGISHFRVYKCDEYDETGTVKIVHFPPSRRIIMAEMELEQLKEALSKAGIRFQHVKTITERDMLFCDYADNS